MATEDDELVGEWEAALAELSPQRAAFVRAYVSNGYNGAAAAREAGYADVSARQQASRLMTNDDVRAAVDVHWRAGSMTADEIRGRLARHARGTLAPFLDIDGAGEVLVLLGTDEAQAHLDTVKKLKVKSRVLKMDEDSCVVDQSIEIELYDAQSALDKLARTRGMYKDRLSVDVEDGPERAAARRAEAQERREVLRRALAMRRGGEEE